jgi:hypothetical protein
MSAAADADPAAAAGIGIAAVAAAAAAAGVGAAAAGGAGVDAAGGGGGRKPRSEGAWAKPPQGPSSMLAKQKCSSTACKKLAGTVNAADLQFIQLVKEQLLPHGSSCSDDIMFRPQIPRNIADDRVTNPFLHVAHAVVVWDPILWYPGRACKQCPGCHSDTVKALEKWTDARLVHDMDRNFYLVSRRYKCQMPTCSFSTGFSAHSDAYVSKLPPDIADRLRQHVYIVSDKSAVSPRVRDHVLSVVTTSATVADSLTILKRTHTAEYLRVCLEFGRLQQARQRLIGSSSSSGGSSGGGSSIDAATVVTIGDFDDHCGYNELVMTRDIFDAILWVAHNQLRPLHRRFMASLDSKHIAFDHTHSDARKLLKSNDGSKRKTTMVDGLLAVVNMKNQIICYAYVQGTTNASTKVLLKEVHGNQVARGLGNDYTTTRRPQVYCRPTGMPRSCAIF